MVLKKCLLKTKVLKHYINTYFKTFKNEIKIFAASVYSSKMDFSTLLKGFGGAFRNCTRYFEEQVHPLLASSFTNLRIEYGRGSHCARVYEGTRYDGISISVSGSPWNPSSGPLRVYALNPKMHRETFADRG